VRASASSGEPMVLRGQEEGKSARRLIVRRRGVARQPQHPTRQRADCPLVLPHESIWPTDGGGKADDRSHRSWCTRPRDDGLACHCLGQGPPERASAPKAYRAGVTGRAMGEGARLTTSPDPLVECQSLGDATRDRQSGETDTGYRSGPLGEPGEASGGAWHATAAGLSCPTAPTRVDAAGPWPEAPPRYGDKAGPGHADGVSARARPDGRHDGGATLLWVSTRTLHRRGDRTVSTAPESHHLGAVALGGRHAVLLCCHLA